MAIDKTWQNQSKLVKVRNKSCDTIFSKVYHLSYTVITDRPIKYAGKETTESIFPQFNQSINVSPRCFSHGVKLNPLKMYPPVEFPVSRDTPLISSLVAQAWDHSVDWPVPKPEDFENGSGSSSADTSYEIDMSEDSPDEYFVCKNREYQLITYDMT